VIDVEESGGIDIRSYIDKNRWKDLILKHVKKWRNHEMKALIHHSCEQNMIKNNKLLDFINQY
jgi:hypothetical protein